MNNKVLEKSVPKSVLLSKAQTSVTRDACGICKPSLGLSRPHTVIRQNKVVLTKVS